MDINGDGHSDVVTLCDKTLRLVPNDRTTRPYLFWALQSRRARAHIEQEATGSSQSMRNISQDKIRAIEIPCPPPDRQTAIVEVLEGVRQTERIARRRLQALTRLRMGLMHDLLTGRRRVNLDPVAV